MEVSPTTPTATVTISEPTQTVDDPPPTTPLNPNRPPQPKVPVPISHRRKYQKRDVQGPDILPLEFKAAKKRALITSSEHEMLSAQDRPPTPYHPWYLPPSLSMDNNRKIAHYEIREKQFKRLVLSLSHIVSEYMALTPALIEAVMKIQDTLEEPVIGHDNIANQISPFSQMQMP